MSASEERKTKRRQKSGGDPTAVRVCLRVRPMNRLEKRTGQKEAWHIDGNSLLQLHQPRTTKNKKEKDPMVATFDEVFGPEDTNDLIFEKIGRPIVKSCMDGYHACIFAYGQTSSGKTYTISGSGQQPGIVPRSVDFLFDVVEECPDREFVVTISFIEIYNEIINDLLQPASGNLRVREDRRTGVFIEGLREENVVTAEQVYSLIHAGTSHRHVGKTNYNDVSSRSHTIFRLVVESSPIDDAKGGVRTSALNIVDLAGSENAVKAGSSARIKETGYINKSLLTLGHVIFKLSEGQMAHIPYRDSKLTRILQTSLSGRARVAVVCNISPSSGNLEETISTLKFAMRAKKIENDARLNEKMDGATLLKKYREEIDKLREELTVAREETERIAEEHKQKKERETRLILERNREEKAALEAKIEQLTRLILVSNKSKSQANLNISSVGADASQAAAAATPSPKKTNVRAPPAFQRRPSIAQRYGTAPPNMGELMEVMRRENSLERLRDLDEATGDEALDDVLCSPTAAAPLPSKASALASQVEGVTDVNVLQAHLRRVLEQMTQQETLIETLQRENKELQETLLEKEDLLAEWDTFYVQQNNKMAVVQEQVRKVADSTTTTNKEDLNDLFSAIGLEDEWDAPLVEVAPAGTSAADVTRSRETSRFSAIMDRFKGMEQDFD